MTLKKLLLSNVLSLLLMSVQVTSAQAEEILLQDGSRLQGKILSMENGTYTLQTPSMGVIRLKQSQIRSISQDVSSASGSDPLAAAPMSAGQSAVQSLQSSMTNNPGVMTMIMSLQNDPDMQAVIGDPEVMRAIENFDLEALKNHPKIKKLMQNSKVRDISGSVN
ncbi:MAG: hypothetical protein ACI8Z1_003586 [Candidatus Azotimanducaceae bacterium]|jgi:hypothetical protein